MVSLLVHAALGVTVIWLIVASNRGIFRRTATGPNVSTLELALYVVGVASVILGWYFNIRFVRDYAHGHTNPIWGDGSWAQYIKLMYANPASSSAGEDYTFANVLILPLITIVDGRRRGIARPWLFFVSSLFTSFAFGWAFYLAVVERQRRLGPAVADERTSDMSSAPR
jgi:Terpene cyclase DEP1